MESLKPLVTSFLVFLICAFVSACDYLSSDAQVLNEFRESTPFAKEVGQCVGATGNVEWRVFQPPGNKNPKLKVIEATLTKGEDRLNIQWFYNLETKVSEMAYAVKPGEATNRLFMVMNIGLFCVQSIITGPKAGLKSEGEAPQQPVAEQKLPSRTVAPQSSGAPVEAKTATYKGAYFEITFPADFNVRPLDATPSMKTSAALFSSPDGAMEFYIFSPQWGGDAPGISIHPETEIEISRKSEKGRSSGVEGTYTWTTITAKDKSYTRMYQDFLSTDASIHWVIGMKYKSDATLQQFKGQYANFKASLKQFSDGCVPTSSTVC